MSYSRGYKPSAFHLFAQSQTAQEYSGIQSSKSESSEEVGLLRPRYDQRRNISTAWGYNCVDSFDEDSCRHPSDFEETLAKLYPETVSASDSDSSEETESSAEEDALTQLTRDFETLAAKYPEHKWELSIIGYKAGICEPKGTLAYHPKIHTFIKTLDHVHTDKLPADIQSFNQRIENYLQTASAQPAANKL